MINKLIQSHNNFKENNIKKQYYKNQDKKTFKDWFYKKQNLHFQFEDKNYKPPFFKEGEVWDCYFGENIGFETCGKNDMGQGFTRAVLIIKKSTQWEKSEDKLEDKYVDTGIGGFLAVPLTSPHKSNYNLNFYHQLKGDPKSGYVILQQIRYIDTRRLINKKFEIHSEELKTVKEKIKNSL